MLKRDRADTGKLCREMLERRLQPSTWDIEFGSAHRTVRENLATASGPRVFSLLIH